MEIKSVTDMLLITTPLTVVRIFLLETSHTRNNPFKFRSILSFGVSVVSAAPQRAVAVQHPTLPSRLYILRQLDCR